MVGILVVVYLDFDKNLFAQTFAGVITIVLLITFYILLITDLVRGTQLFITPMVLIIIAIILVAIFSVLYKMDTRFEKSKPERPLFKKK